MYAFYIAKGHSLDDLESLHPYEEIFYQGAMEKYYEDLYTIINTVAISILGSESEKKQFQREMEMKRQ